MKIIVAGKPAPLRSEMVKGFEREGHEVTLVPDRKRWPPGAFDCCVDTSASGMLDIRRTVSALAGRQIHYILLSTCRVYPRVPRLAPWRPEDIDLADEAGFETLDIRIRGQRAAERELRICAGRKVSWTILRPAIIEMKNSPEPQNMWWFVSRILDGGPLVLPDGDDPLFRHVSGADLVRAVLAVVGKKEAFAETIHVVDRALLSHESYARLIMKGLRREVPLVRVADDSWHAAGLSLPMGRDLHSSFIDSSLLLQRLGWQPADEATWVAEYARHLAAHPLEPFPERQLELTLLDLESAEPAPERGQFPGGWCITGIPGKPKSLRLQQEVETRNPALSVLKSRSVAFGMVDELFLTEGSCSKTQVLGQNVLLEVLDPGNTAMCTGELYLPFGPHSCVIRDCGRCAQLVQTDSEIAQEGFARERVQENPEHLMEISREIARFALLVHPLSCLLSVLPYVVHNATGPVWLYGRRVESVLAGFLAADAGISVLHVDRSIERGLLPKEMPLLSLEKARNEVKKEAMAPPAAVVNLSGARDGENLLSAVLQPKGLFVSPFVATGAQARRLTVNLPVLSPGKQWLELAAATIQRWATARDLDPFLRQVSLEQLPELYMTGGFQLPFIEIGRGAQ
ncbi:MAG: Rossmann-fold NAD(P)-binding domain-containing protein [Desulfobulbaceae bacterium]